MSTGASSVDQTNAKHHLITIAVLAQICFGSVFFVIPAIKFVFRGALEPTAITPSLWSFRAHRGSMREPTGELDDGGAPEPTGPCGVAAPQLL